MAEGATPSFDMVLADNIKRRSVLRERKAKIEEELELIKESTLSTMKAEGIEEFTCPKGKITIVTQARFKPFDQVQIQIDQMKRNAEANGLGEDIIVVFPKFTVS